MESWLRFANLQLPPRLAVSLIDRFGTPDGVFRADAGEITDISGMADRFASRIGDPSFIPTDSQLAFMQSRHVKIIPLGDSSFPQNLREIPDPPPVLFVRGELLEKDRFAVAVVGSRHASPYGRSVTAKISRDLAAAGLTVVSGGAIGIDAAAHRAAVEAKGRTIVVLGCGLDVEYPKENLKLFEQIVAEGLGALVTEFPMGATPEPWRFPMRNRIVSGLGMGVVVVEAGRQSGALLTASLAGEQGKDVMAVPGNVDREGCRGTNGLIKDGAVLVENARDVLQALGVLALESPDSESRSQRTPVDLPPGHRKLLESLSLTPKHIDTIAVDLGMTTVEISVQMTMLELSGQVRRLPGNCYIRML